MIGYALLTNALETFQTTMNQIFSWFVDMYLVVYLEDILLYNETREQPLKDLEAVFTLLQEHWLLTKGSKCEFLKDRLDFLGHVISTRGVKVDPCKIETVQAWLPHTNLQELQSFVGFVNYPEYGGVNCTVDRPAA
ncbi:hypothetical protein CLOM_g15540 [Closterium sp. NIES-68]|nr:hypothetical protein CLOM_g15540 [Closterium sp. NIES-68]